MMMRMQTAIIGVGILCLVACSRDVATENVILEWKPSEEELPADYEVTEGSVHILRSAKAVPDDVLGKLKR